MSGETADYFSIRAKSTAQALRYDETVVAIVAQFGYDSGARQLLEQSSRQAEFMIERDWLDHEFIRDYTSGFDQVAEYCREWTLSRTADVTGVPQRAIAQAAEWWGTAKTSFLFHARGIEHHSNGVQNSLATINLVLASGRIGKPKSGYGTIVGQANGQGGREHGQKCDQLPGWRDISNPEHRRYVAGVWGIEEQELPGPGVDAYELFRKIDRGEIKGLLSICFNPKVSLPDNGFVTRCLDKLEFYAAIDFFLNDTAWHADVVLPGSLQEEDEGTVTQVEGRIIKINKAVDCPGEARQDWRIIQDIAQALGRPTGFTFTEPREIFDELRIASKGGVADYSGVTYEKVTEQLGVFWPCYSEDPKTGQPTERLRDVLDDAPVLARLTGAVHGLVDLDDAPFDLGDRAFVLLLEAARQDDVGVPRRVVHEEVDGGVELQLFETARDKGIVRQRHFRVEADREQALDLAAVDLAEQLVGIHAGARELLLIDPPDPGDVAPMLGVADVPPAGELIAFLPVFATALSIRLADNRAVAALRLADPA